MKIKLKIKDPADVKFSGGEIETAVRAAGVPAEACDEWVRAIQGVLPGFVAEWAENVVPEKIGRGLAKRVQNEITLQLSEAATQILRGQGGAGITVRFELGLVGLTKMQQEYYSWVASEVARLKSARVPRRPRLLE